MQRDAGRHLAAAVGVGQGVHRQQQRLDQLPLGRFERFHLPVIQRVEGSHQRPEKAGQCARTAGQRSHGRRRGRGGYHRQDDPRPVGGAILDGLFDPPQYRVLARALDQQPIAAAQVQADAGDVEVLGLHAQVLRPALAWPDAVPRSAGGDRLGRLEHLRLLLLAGGLALGLRTGGDSRLLSEAVFQREGEVDAGAQPGAGAIAHQSGQVHNRQPLGSRAQVPLVGEALLVEG